MHSLTGRGKRRKEMKKFKMSLTIEGIKGNNTSDAEERLRHFIFLNRRYWKLDILDIQEEGDE